MQAKRFKRIGTAGWLEPAPPPEHRADHASIPNDRCHQQPRHQCRRTAQSRIMPGMLRTHGCCHALTCRRSNLPSTRSNSAARSRWRASAARGLARMTSRLPAGRQPARARATSRSRRRTRLRTTAPPSARVTTKPTRAGDAPSRATALSDAACAPHLPSGRTSRPRPLPAAALTPSPTKRCAASSWPPARRPRRTASSKSLRRLILAAAGNTMPLLHEAHESARPDPAGLRHALRLVRPLRRRAARIARPARVRMRSRKPCVFARRRLLGWKVRLLTVAPDESCLLSAHRPSCRGSQYIGRRP